MKNSWEWPRCGDDDVSSDQLYAEHYPTSSPKFHCILHQKNLGLNNNWKWVSVDPKLTRMWANYSVSVGVAVPLYLSSTHAR
jgi:hypothetical protein